MRPPAPELYSRGRRRAACWRTGRGREAGGERGAEALGLDAGRIATGALADLTIVDLDTPSLAGWTDETLLASLLLGTGNDAIAGTIVGGAL